jgi:putative solute:sodium symporter small subunit
VSEEAGERGDEAGNDVAGQYWRANIALLTKLLAVWFAVSFGAGILFVEQLNAYEFFGFKLGFWFAQQGSIFVFVVLIFIYTARMHALEKKFGLSDDDEPDSYDLIDDDGDDGDNGGAGGAP